MYKMLTDCGFLFIKSEKLRTKMFHSAKKVTKIPPPHSFFFLTFAPRKCELSCKRLIYITEVSHVVQVRAEGPKAPEAARPERAEAPSPGHRPGYNSNQQGAL